MKPITNKYWYVHGWYTFYLLDSSTHRFAIDYIWECVTWNVNIYYHLPILPADLNNIKIKQKIIHKTNSTLLIESQILIEKQPHVTAFFTFIKINK